MTLNQINGCFYKTPFHWFGHVYMCHLCSYTVIFEGLIFGDGNLIEKDFCDFVSFQASSLGPCGN